MLVGPSKCLKPKIQIELNRVKNPNWPEASLRSKRFRRVRPNFLDELARKRLLRGLTRGKPAGYLQAWPRIWTRDYRVQIKPAVREGLELEDSGLQV